MKNNSLWTVDTTFINIVQISWRIWFNILTQSEDGNRVNCLVLKNKTTESNSAAISFTWTY